MKIEKLSIKNFRCFNDFSVKFNDRMTVFIGDNATGKTSILAAIYLNMFYFLPKIISKSSMDYYEIAPDKIKEVETNEIESCITAAYTSGESTVASFEHDTTLQDFSQYFPVHGEDETFLYIKDKCENVLKNDKENIPIFRIYQTGRWHNPQNFYDEETIKGIKHQRLNQWASMAKDGIEFNDFYAWFLDKEVDRLLEAGEGGDKESLMRNIKNAIESMLPGYSGMRLRPNKFGMKNIVFTENISKQIVPVNVLSSGYISILSIAADIAYKMSKLNPHLENPLTTEGIILIDEIDLSLHPKWQQRVLGDLQKVFPNVQFIVTTHSPLVLTTVHPDNIVRLARIKDGEIKAQYGKDLGISTYGADSMRLMRYFMDVFPRPQMSKELIDSYFALIDQGKGETKKALQLRMKIKQMMPDDNILRQADELIAHVKRFS